MIWKAGLLRSFKSSRNWLKVVNQFLFWVTLVAKGFGDAIQSTVTVALCQGAIEHLPFLTIIAIRHRPTVDFKRLFALHLMRLTGKLPASETINYAPPMAHCCSFHRLLLPSNSLYRPLNQRPLIALDLMVEQGRERAYSAATVPISITGSMPSNSS